VRVVLDGSVVYESQGAGYKYFQGMLPRLRNQPDLQLDLIPSPTGLLDGLGKSFGARALRKARAVFWRWRAASQGPSLFHSYYYTRSPVRDWPELQVVHDLISERFSPRDPFCAQKRTCIESATHLLAVSENTKRDLSEFYGIAPHKIDVVPQAIDAAYFAQSVAPQALRQTLDKYRLDRPYFLQVGGRMHHKNFARALEAFALARLGGDYLLVCAGEWLSPEEQALIAKLNLRDSIRHAHWPVESELRNLYRQAKGLIYPSLYEGFGIPPLEAMASGIPVAASRVASIPEVCGEAAAYFDPTDPADIARAWTSLTDRETARALVARGPSRLRLFDWDRVAEATLDIYRRLWGHPAQKLAAAR
jgi:glycosyltransferase involved in cell wall biosynthesis